MSLFDRFVETLREGAADLLGYGQEIEMLREATADGRMLARRVEDAAFGNLLGARDPGDQEGSRYAHRETVQRAFLYYFGDPLVRRTVDLQTFYTLGTGITRPTFTQPDADRLPDAAQETSGQPDSASKRGQDLVNAIWEDEENKRTLTSTAAQYAKNLELQAQGNLFFRLFTNAKGTSTPLRISDLPDVEITDVIRHPGNKMPLYYLREYTPQMWNPDSHTYTPGATQRVHYLGVNAAPPRDGEIFDGQEWRNPPKDAIGEGRVLHIKVNCTSHMRFGLSELMSYLDISRELNAYMASRMSIVKALASVAMQMKVSGGPRAAAQQSAKLQEIQRLAAAVDEGVPQRRRGTEQQTKVAVTNRSTELQPMVADTGAAGASTDIATMKGFAAAGSGIPVTHLGAEPGALAGGIAQDVSLHRLITARQTLWTDDIIKPIFAYALTQAGISPEGLKVSAPPAVERDVGMVITNLVALITTLDPSLQNRPLQRFVLREVLDTLGKEDAAELVDAILPLQDLAVPGWPEGEVSDDSAQSAGQNVSGSIQAAVDANASAARGYGLRQASERSSPTSDASVRLGRAQQRVGAMEAAIDPGLLDDALAAMRDIDATLGATDGTGG